MPLISIIIPVYNVEAYIKKSLESVLQQSHSDFEIIIIDDGSTDKSVELAKMYESKDSRIRIYSKTNGGLSSARNFGIGKAQGQYITFLDSDDYIAKDYLKVLYENLIKYDSDISIVGFLFDKSGTIESTSRNNYFEEVLDSEKAILSMYSHPCASPITFVTSWGKLYKKELFSDIKFPVGKLHEDEFTTYKLYLSAKNIVFINEALYFYRQRSGSIMSQNYSLSRLDIIDAFEDRMQQLKFNHIDITETQYRYQLLLSWNMYMLRKNNYPQQYNIIRSKFLKLYPKLKYKCSIKRKVKLFILKNFNNFYYKYIVKI